MLIVIQLHIFAGFFQSVDTLIISDFQQAFDRHADDRYGEGLCVITHIIDVTIRRRGMFIVRHKLWPEIATGRVFALSKPIEQ